MSTNWIRPPRATHLAICAGLLISACTSTPPGPRYVSPDDPNAAVLVAEKGSVWGAFNGRVATTAIKEVDGHPFEGYRHPIKIDDQIRLRPGPHAVGVRLWGSPRDPREGFESYICLRFTSSPEARYVLRGGFVDMDHFRLELIGVLANREQLISVLKVPLDIKRANPICLPDASHRTTSPRT